MNDAGNRLECRWYFGPLLYNEGWDFRADCQQSGLDPIWPRCNRLSARNLQGHDLGVPGSRRLPKAICSNHRGQPHCPRLPETTRRMFPGTGRMSGFSEVIQPTYEALSSPFCRLTRT